MENLSGMINDIVSWLEESTGFEFFSSGNKIKCLNKMVGASLSALINAHWIYDPEQTDKRCAYLRGVGEDMHILIKLHKDTYFIE